MRAQSRHTLSFLASTALFLGGVTSLHAAEPETKSFEQINREGSVDLASVYNLDGLTIPEGQIHTLLPRDAIPSLTDPALVPLSEAGWLTNDDRIIDVTIGDESVAVPLKILNFHEVANITVGGDPVAATYCPLCDSVTLVRRTVLITPADPLEDAHEEVLDFGVSGALYNSNVLMYDRQYMGLWSQLGLEAVSGPLVGTALDMLPVKVVPFSQFKKQHPAGMVISNETGHNRSYDGNPYQRYFENEEYIMVPIGEFGDALPKKTLGLGVKAGEQSFFVPASSIGERFVIKTDAGDVIAVSTPAGVQVIGSPAGVQTVQSFYYSFSAFHPQTVVLTESAD